MTDLLVIGSICAAAVIAAAYLCLLYIASPPAHRRLLWYLTISSAMSCAAVEELLITRFQPSALVWPMIGSGIAVAFLGHRRAMRYYGSSSVTGRCSECGYETIGEDGNCVECGCRTRAMLVDGRVVITPPRKTWVEPTRIPLLVAFMIGVAGLTAASAAAIHLLIDSRFVASVSALGVWLIGLFAANGLAEVIAADHSH